MIVDYNLTTDSSFGNIYTIQMLDVDLQTATDDEFSYDPQTGITAIHQGQVFIGLAYYNKDMANHHGHNAGEISPDLFDGEDAIYAHMSAPNNESTSATKQN